MNKQEIIHIVITRPPTKDDKKFNQWYNEVHVPLILKFKKITSVTRYKVVADSEPAQYVAIYRFKNKADFDAYLKSPERDAALQEMQETWGNKIKIDSVIQCESIMDWQQ